MKRILVLILVLGGAGIGGYYYATGRLPWVDMSPEELQVSALREEFEQIRQQWRAAGRAATTGMDTGSITDVPLARLEQLDRNLTALNAKLKTPEARNLVGALRRDRNTFKSEMK